MINVTRGRAPGFDRTSTRAKRKGKKRSEKPTLRRTAKRRGSPRPRPPPPARGDAGLTCRPSEAAQAPGLGPASARRATRRAPGTRGARRPARSRFHGTTRAQHTHWGRAAGGAAVGPRARRLPFGPLAAGLAAARRRAAGADGSLSFPGGLTPLETARDDDRAAGAPSPPAGPLPPGGPADGERAPPPAPEADATETRAGVASARGLPDGQAPPSPGPHSRDRRRRVAPPRPLASARARRKAYGAEPGGNARSPRFHAETGRGKRPRGRPHAFLRPTRGREGRRRTRRAGPGPGPPPATAGALRPTVPAGGGHPSSGAAAARHGVARARGPPPTEGPPDARPPGGRAIEPGGGRRPADGAAGAFEEEGRRGERGRTRGTRRRARERPRQRAEERARRTPAAATPRPRKGRERALSAGVARYDEASGSAPAADRAAAASPPRPGRGEGGAGRPSPARRGYPARARAAVAPHRRPATPAAAAAAAAGTAAATAGRAEPPESLNRRPARRPPFGPRSGVWRRRGGNLGGGGEPPRRGALGTWPWGEGNDLHGPAGVPPPLPPSGERPPAGARPTSAATTAASFSGPGVSLSSPALRPRGPPRLGPPRRRGDAARPPSAPRPRARARAPKRGPERPEGARPSGARGAPLGPRAGTLAGPAKAPLPGAGRAGGAASSEPRRRPRHPLPRHFHIGRRRVPRPDGRPSLDGRSSEGRDGRASGRGRAEHPSLPAPGRLLARTEESRPRENSGRR
ncbi:collagen alpha-1(I) chain-like [Ammospiza nelsoni]|uniref:collagen alpha-1(I) chain-like n=1 Tax=Ammospiza nelsoni TaxID=2857394 RepID=UPI002869B2D2|nr:collagen alpha-1(I) chain-like [Ammospiza nelsoni]